MSSSNIKVIKEADSNPSVYAEDEQYSFVNQVNQEMSDEMWQLLSIIERLLRIEYKEGEELRIPAVYGYREIHIDRVEVDKKVLSDFKKLCKIIVELNDDLDKALKQSSNGHISLTYDSNIVLIFETYENICLISIVLNSGIS